MVFIFILNHFYALSNDRKSVLIFGEKKFYLTGGPDDIISRDHHNYKNVTIVCFFFHYFPIRNISMNKICL